MHRTSLAPVLSATLSRDSCWIISVSPCRPGSHCVSLGEPSGCWQRLLAGPACLLGALEDLHDAPTLGGGQRTGLHDQDPVADATVVLLVVRLELGRASQDLAVEGVLDAVLDGDHDGLVHLVADDEALAGLARPALLCLCVAHVVLTLGAHATSPSVVMP